MSLFINSLGGGHAQTCMHTNIADKKQFQKLVTFRRLDTMLSLYSNVFVSHKCLFTNSQNSIHFSNLDSFSLYQRFIPNAIVFVPTLRTKLRPYIIKCV